MVQCRKKYIITIIIIIVMIMQSSIAFGATSKINTKKANLKSIEVVEDKYIKIKWASISNISGYQIYRATSANGTYKKIATVKSSKVSYVDKKINIGKRYYYKIRAYKTVNNKKIYGKYSDKKSAKVIDYCAQIPNYWYGAYTDSAGIAYNNYLQEKIDKINNLHQKYGDNCFSFIQIADIHFPANASGLSPLIARKIVNETPVENIICTGDWQTRSCFSTKEGLLQENQNIWEMFKVCSKWLLLQRGNHDGAYGTRIKKIDGAQSALETYIYDISLEELKEVVYRKMDLYDKLHFDKTGTAYYYDDKEQNVRYIGLNTQCTNYEVNADGTAKYPSFSTMRFTQSQFDFIINEALVDGIKAETKIVVFGHVPLNRQLGDGELMQKVLQAYKNRGHFRGTYEGSMDDYFDYVKVDVDFSNAKGKLVGYFCGHNHVDDNYLLNDVPIIITRCDAFEENDVNLRRERIKGTITEQSFSVFTVTENKIYITKVGAGSDDYILY